MSNDILCALIDDQDGPREKMKKILVEEAVSMQICIEPVEFRNATEFEHAVRDGRCFPLTISDVHMPETADSLEATIEQGGEKVFRIIREKKKDDPAWISAHLLWHSQQSGNFILGLDKEEEIFDYTTDNYWFCSNHSRFDTSDREPRFRQNLRRTLGWLKRYFPPPIRIISKINEEKFPDFIGRSEKMASVFRLVERVAPARSTVLITGESGTGKELVAKAIHKASPRAEQPFVPVNCSNIPSELLESELFGHTKGAFTGAVAAKKGLFEVADGGSIFLDETGDLRPETQVRLLRVIQEREFTPLGKTTPVKVDVRIIAATNVDLKEAVRNGTFREDLYYRLSVVPIELPPLRDRKEDVLPLAQFFIRECNAENQREISENLSPEVLSLLEGYYYPGNVRELENIIERAVVIAPTNEITVECLRPEVRDYGVDNYEDELKNDKDRHRFANLRDAICNRSGHEKGWISDVADLEGVSITAIMYWLENREKTSEYLKDLAERIRKGLVKNDPKQLSELEQKKHENRLRRFFDQD